MFGECEWLDPEPLLETLCEVRRTVKSAVKSGLGNIALGFQ